MFCHTLLPYYIYILTINQQDQALTSPLTSNCNPPLGHQPAPKNPTCYYPHLKPSAFALYNPLARLRYPRYIIKRVSHWENAKMPTPIFKTELRKGRGVFTRGASYAVIVSYASDASRVHVATFYGDDGRSTRAQALRYAKSVVSRDYFPWPRNPYLPAQYGI